MNFLLFVFISLAFAQEQQYPQHPCNIDDMSLAGKQYDFVPVTPSSKGVKRKVGGTLIIKDGCNFECRNCTVIPPGLKAYWYGIPQGQPDGKLFPRIVPDTLGTMEGQDFNFKLSGVSWGDMDGVGVYDENDNLALWVPDKSDDSGADVNGATVTFMVTLIVIGFALMN